MANFKLKRSYYRSHTPKSMRKLGDSILISAPILQSAVMTLPLTDNHMIWVNFTITIITIAGKIITNFFVDDSEVQEK